MYLVRWLIAAIVLPGTVLVFVPLGLLRLTQGAGWPDAAAGPADPWFWAALLAGLAGAFWSGWSVSLFFRFGQGTAAPWDPPRSFVVRGPYRHVRNPMIIGVFLMLLGEALLFRSPALLAWLAAFVAGNLLYIPLVEEKGLQRRFGEHYAAYRRQVPRWVPRRSAWRPGGAGGDAAR